MQSTFKILSPVQDQQLSIEDASNEQKLKSSLTDLKTSLGEAEEQGDDTF